MTDDLDKKGYDVKNMQAYFKFVEVKYFFYSNGYHEAYYNAIIHTLKESNRMFTATMSFPFENGSLIHFEAKIKDRDCEPTFSYAKGTVKYQYVMSISFNCKEKIPKDSDIEINLHFKLMDWVLNSKEKILDVLKKIYGDTYIAFLLPVTATTPIMEYNINLIYPGFKIKKSKKVIADKTDVYGKPLSVISEEEIPHKDIEVSVNLKNLSPNITYVVINYLD